MDDRENVEVDIRFRLLKALDWTQRTGWPSRREDTKVAARIFDTWLAATDAQACETGGRDRLPLLETLYAAFNDPHGVEAAQHLCVIFDVALEAHVRLRDDGRGGALP